MMTSKATSAWSAPGDSTRTGGKSIGVLLIHGFTGSPASMTPWAQALNDAGYAVSVPRLPGHGTTWQDMNRTRWSDWYGEVRHAYAQLRDSSERTAICGLSMGGTLALRLAVDQPQAMSALVLVNPAVNSLRKDAALLPVLKHVIPAFPGISNDIKKPNQNEHAYSKTPLKAAHSLFQSWAELRPELHHVVAPVQYFRSTVDHAVDDSSQEIIKAGVSSQTLEFQLLEDSYHVATLDNDAAQIFSESTRFISAHTS